MGFRVEVVGTRVQVLLGWVELDTPFGGVPFFYQKSTGLTQLTLGTYVVQIWSRYGRNLEPTKPSNCTERLSVFVLFYSERTVGVSPYRSHDSAG